MNGIGTIAFMDDSERTKSSDNVLTIVNLDKSYTRVNKDLSLSLILVGLVIGTSGVTTNQNGDQRDNQHRVLHRGNTIPYGLGKVKGESEKITSFQDFTE
jgi:hypothetical protein